MKKKNFIFFPCVIIILSGYLYISKLFPINPFYLGFILATLAFSFIIISKPNIKIFKNFKGVDVVLPFIHILLIAHIIINSLMNHIALKSPLLTCFSILYFYFPLKVSKIERNKQIHFFTLLKFASIFSLLFECIYRLSHPVFYLGFNHTRPLKGIYIYKFSSVMFQDSNQVGIIILCLIALFLFLNERKIFYTSKKIFLLLLVLLFFSFSRASLFGICVFIFYQSFYKKVASDVKLFLILVFLILLFFTLIYFFNDGSFKTKLDIFEKTYKWLLKSNVSDFFLGVGFNKSIVAIGRYAHNYISLFLIEYGIIGLFLFLAQFLVLTLLARGTSFVIIPYLIAGLSFIPMFSPYLYLTLGIIFSYDYFDTKGKNEICIIHNTKIL